MKITEEQVDQFQKDGAILLENAFSKDWIEKIKTGIEVSSFINLPQLFCICIIISVISEVTLEISHLLYIL